MQPHHSTKPSRIQLFRYFYFEPSSNALAMAPENNVQSTIQAVNSGQSIRMASEA